MQATRRKFIVLSSAALAASAFGQSVAASAPIHIVATTGMIGDAARVIGGDQVKVHTLMGAGVDPHAYRQTRSDISRMIKADLVLWHGLYLEAQMEEFFHKMSSRIQTVAVAEGLPSALLHAHPTYADKVDPHIWMAPAIWSEVVNEILAALSKARPELAAMFEVNAQAYRDEIAKLHGYAKATLASVPASARVLLTAHDAFGYFGEAYDFEVIGIQGISTESEAGLNRISTLVDMLVERKIGAVFVESSVSDRNVRALVEGAAAQGHEMRIGGELFSDAMGKAGTYEGTYLGMIDHNVSVIAGALGGDVPAGGRVGKLSAGI